MAEKPLFVREPEEVHEYLDEVKSRTGLNRSEFVFLMVSYFMKNMTYAEIAKMEEDFRFFGPEALVKENANCI